MIKFRNLNPDEIQVRMDSCSAKGARFLLYKDARCDMDILDETVGEANWQRKHYEQKGNLYCSVGINTEFENIAAPPSWVWKDDCGTESNTEKEKGEASDSFKRACVNWGIGRELYTKIPIFIQIETVDTGKKKPNGKPIYAPANPFEQFHVSEIEYDKKRISRLIIADSEGVVAFKWQKENKENSGKFVCQSCGKVLKPATDKNGKYWAVRELSEKSKSVYGECLCADCMGAKNANRSR